MESYKEKNTFLTKLRRVILENKKWIVLAIFIVAFIIIAESVLRKENLVFDGVIYQFIVTNRNTVLNSVFKILTQFGSAICLIIVTILCIIFVKNKKYKMTIPLNLSVIFLINLLLKNIFARPRPEQIRIIEETGFSFPSGHAMVSMAFYGYLIYLIHKSIKNNIIKHTISSILAVLILIIGFSRVYLGVHYASDVVGGICFSLAYLIFMISSGIYK